MNLLHSLWIGDDQVIIAAVVALTAKLLRGQVLRLQAGAHGAIENKYLLFEGVQVAAVGVVFIRHVNFLWRPGSSRTIACVQGATVNIGGQERDKNEQRIRGWHQSHTRTLS